MTLMMGLLTGIYLVNDLLNSLLVAVDSRGVYVRF